MGVTLYSVFSFINRWIVIIRTMVKEHEYMD